MTKKKKIIISLIIIFVVFIITGLILGNKYYKKIFSANVNKTCFVYIPTNSTYKQVIDTLKANKVLIDSVSFKQLAEFKKYPEKIKSGKYKVEKGMNNNVLINMLKSGRQSPVKLTFNNIRTIEQFAGKVAKKIETDSASIIELLKDENFIEDLGFTKITILELFIPNTYEIYWNLSAKSFIERMKTEYDKFWNKDREEKANKIGLTKHEVSTLASIVQAEQSAHNNEKATIAGLYMNRIKIGMILQSDPTIIYALGDYTIKRVLIRHKDIDSPYNTYKYAGLPPGPINMPEISSIDAVLNYEKNEYLYMCAKEDFSGYHNFSTNSHQHGIYARKYQNALNRRKIWK